MYFISIYQTLGLIYYYPKLCKNTGGVSLTRETYAEMTLVDLKNKAKDLGIKNISKLKKSEIIDELMKVTPNTIEKNGVILTEKIAPKIRDQESNTALNNYQNRNKTSKTDEEKEEK